MGGRYYLHGNIEIQNDKILPPGLYLCPRELVEEWNQVEERMFQAETMVKPGRQLKIFPVAEKPRFEEFPILPRSSFTVRWCSQGDPCAGFCKH